MRDKRRAQQLSLWFCHSGWGFGLRQAEAVMEKMKGQAESKSH